MRVLPAPTGACWDTKEHKEQVSNHRLRVLHCKSIDFLYLCRLATFPGGYDLPVQDVRPRRAGSLSRVHSRRRCTYPLSTLEICLLLYCFVRILWHLKAVT